MSTLNLHAIRAIYRFEMARTFRTLGESIASPVLSTSLYFVVFGAAVTKSVLLGLLILLTARLFVPYEIAHPLWMLGFLLLTAISFCLFGFIIGLWADDFQKLQVIPLMVMTPLTFLGGAFYSIDMLPPVWQKITLFNPVVYLISGFRWSFYGVADVNVAVSLAAILGFLALCLAVVWWIFRSGWKLKA
jgi:ABC-2 type transport system permease protein